MTSCCSKKSSCCLCLHGKAQVDAGPILGELNEMCSREEVAQPRKAENTERSTETFEHGTMLDGVRKKKKP